MSVQHALSFIKFLRSHLAECPGEREEFFGANIDQLLDLAKKNNFSISSDELRSAHLLDWRMRLQHFTGSSTQP